MTERLFITEQQYRGIDLPSYSSLKKLLESGPRSLDRKYKLDSDAIDFGSLLDCRLLCPSEFSNKFYFDATEKPTAQVLELADHLVKLYPEGLPEGFGPGDAEGFASELNLFGGTKDALKRIAKFDNDIFWNYIKARHNSAGKTVFTPDVETEVYEAEQIIKTHPKSAHLFKPTKHQEMLTQVMVISEVNGFKFKSMIDFIIIDHKLKTITPYDLKATEYRQINFPKQFERMHYNIQAALYREAVLRLASIMDLGDYEVMAFKFLVYSRSDKYPFVWTYPVHKSMDTMTGYSMPDGEVFPGVNNLLSDYYYYVKTGATIERQFIERDEIFL